MTYTPSYKSKLDEMITKFLCGNEFYLSVLKVNILTMISLFILIKFIIESKQIFCAKWGSDALWIQTWHTQLHLIDFKHN